MVEDIAYERLEEDLSKAKRALQLIKDNCLNPAHTMTKLGLEDVVDCCRKIAVETLDII